MGKTISGNLILHSPATAVQAHCRHEMLWHNSGSLIERDAIALEWEVVLMRTYAQKIGKSLHLSSWGGFYGCWRALTFSPNHLHF